MTDAERVLWSVLRRNQVDGSQHFEEENVWRDYHRTQWFREQGFRVVRFTNDEVFQSAEDVAREVRRALLESAAHPPSGRHSRAQKRALRPPSPARGEGET